MVKITVKNATFLTHEEKARLQYIIEDYPTRKRKLTIVQKKLFQKISRQFETKPFDFYFFLVKNDGNEILAAVKRALKRSIVRLKITEQRTREYETCEQIYKIIKTLHSKIELWSFRQTFKTKSYGRTK